MSGAARRQAPRRPARRPRRRPRLLRARRELPRRARRPLRLADPPHHLPPRGGAANMAEAYGKLTGRPGICLVTRGPGRDAGVGRRAHGVPGLDAADPARRPGRLRPGGARGVPGGRLPAHVRPAGEVGRADRPRRPHPRVRRARVRDRVRRAARARSCSRCRRTCSRARPTSPTREPFHVVAAAPGSRATSSALRALLERGRAAARARRRRRLDAGAPRADLQRVPRGERAARRRRVPPPGRARQRLAELRRRRRHRHQPEARRARARGRPAARRRAAARRDDDVRLHAARVADAAADARARPSRAPRSSAASTGRRCRSSPASAQFAARRARPARRAALARVDGGRARRLRGVAGARADAAATLDLGACVAHLRERAAATRSSRTAPATSRVWVHRFWRWHALPDAARADERRDGLRRAGGGRRQARRPRAHRGLLRRRRRLPDERPGARDGGAVRPADRRSLVVNNGMYGTIRMHQERHFPGRVVGTDLVNPDFAALRARLRRARRDRRAHGRSSRRRSSARSPPGTAAVLALRIDPEAITPRTTLSAIRARHVSDPLERADHRGRAGARAARPARRAPARW